MENLEKQGNVAKISLTTIGILCEVKRYNGMELQKVTVDTQHNEVLHITCTSVYRARSSGISGPLHRQHKSAVYPVHKP